MLSASLNKTFPSFLHITVKQIVLSALLNCFLRSFAPQSRLRRWPSACGRSGRGWARWWTWRACARPATPPPTSPGSGTAGRSGARTTAPSRQTTAACPRQTCSSSCPSPTTTTRTTGAGRPTSCLGRQSPTPSLSRSCVSSHGNKIKLFKKKKKKIFF